MTDKITEYRRADSPLPEKNLIWPLYGAGFDNLGLDGRPIEVPMPSCGADELLVRHDACGLCFSDIKVLKAGEDHPRIYRDMRSDPVVLGHEVSMTVVGIGEGLKDEYSIGDRFIVQADIFVGGIGYAYGYEIQGGLSLYNVIDRRILSGDDGCYLIEVQPSTGYAESALTEPWACVIASYGLTYRNGLKPGGTTWIIGAAPDESAEYSISRGFNRLASPSHLLLTAVPDNFSNRLKERAEELGVDVFETDDITSPPVAEVDDIVLLGADADIIEKVGPILAPFGILVIVADAPLSRKVEIDIGRVHYNRWVHTGGSDPDISQAYDEKGVRSALRPGGRAWFAGAGGPMGRMHVQRAIQIADGPSTILCTDISGPRLHDLHQTMALEAETAGIQFHCLNPSEAETYEREMSAFRPDRFDDIVILAPDPSVIAECASWLADDGVMNVFAGLARGTMAAVDLSDAYLRGTRIIGHSASTIEDLRLMLHEAESGRLSPGRSVAAIGSLSAAAEGLKAVRDTLFPGKIIIYPQIEDFPLTALSELKEELPAVFMKLKEGREWTVEAEDELLRELLP